MKIKDKEIMVEIEGHLFHCAMDVSMNYIGGKWKTVVLWYLKNDKKRFAEINKLIPQMTERMLSITLKQLEEDGLVLREVYTTKPPLKVEYSLTEFGRSCLPMLNEISNWGRLVSKSKGKILEF
ncbi:MAG: winged helix-turn-helix transcriptional regulator [Leadbetterella sp.]